jgi:hypothetical protein
MVINAKSLNNKSQDDLRKLIRQEIKGVYDPVVRNVMFMMIELIERKGQGTSRQKMLNRHGMGRIT